MTNLLERETFKNKSELTRLNNLNNRFVDFLNLVKSEKTRSDYLQSSLLEHKQIYIQNFKGIISYKLKNCFFFFKFFNFLF
jgi:hypothetical protein